jgi:hypothetical protein
MNSVMKIRYFVLPRVWFFLLIYLWENIVHPSLSTLVLGEIEPTFTSGVDSDLSMASQSIPAMVSIIGSGISISSKPTLSKLIQIYCHS